MLALISSLASSGLVPAYLFLQLVEAWMTPFTVFNPSSNTIRVVAIVLVLVVCFTIRLPSFSIPTLILLTITLTSLPFLALASVFHFF